MDLKSIDRHSEHRHVLMPDVIKLFPSIAGKQSKLY